MNNLLLQQELMLTEHLLLSQGAHRLSDLLRKNGGINDCLFRLGLLNDFYSNISKNQLPELTGSSGNRFCEASEVSPDRIEGPWCTDINHCESPYRPFSFGAVIKRSDDYYFTYGLMSHVKAVLMFYGDNPLDAEGTTLMDLLGFDEVDFRNDRYTLELCLEGFYCGNAGDFTIGSASCEDVPQHEVSVKQPIKFVNDYVFFPVNALYSSDTKLKLKKLGVRPEFRNNKELDKYEIMSLIALKKGSRFTNSLGHSLSIESPKSISVDCLRYHPNGTILTLYEPIESPFLPYHAQLDEPVIINELFVRVMREAVQMYYVDGEPGRRVDYQLLSKYGEFLLTPKLRCDLTINQLSLEDRQCLTDEFCGEPSRFSINGGYVGRTSGLSLPAGRIKINDGFGLISYTANRDCKVN